MHSSRYLARNIHGNISTCSSRHSTHDCVKIILFFHQFLAKMGRKQFRLLFL